MPRFINHPKEELPMQDYIIMTESCCDLTDQMARELELEELPLKKSSLL